MMKVWWCSGLSGLLLWVKVLKRAAWRRSALSCLCYVSLMRRFQHNLKPFRRNPLPNLPERTFFFSFNQKIWQDQCFLNTTDSSLTLTVWKLTNHILSRFYPRVMKAWGFFLTAVSNLCCTVNLWILISDESRKSHSSTELLSFI